MGGDFGGHTYGDAVGAHKQQVGKFGGEKVRLFESAVEIAGHGNSFFFNVSEHFFRDFGEPGFCIPHGCRRIAVDGTEVALAVDKRIA